jgi:hypothetical protein
MSQATIRLLVNSCARVFPRYKDDQVQAEAARLYLNAGGYITACTLETSEVGKAAAEEMFDLTNNPSRNDERDTRYGSGGRSVSSGDIITVDGVDYLCCSIGWLQL